MRLWACVSAGLTLSPLIVFGHRRHTEGQQQTSPATTRENAMQREYPKSRGWDACFICSALFLLFMRKTLPLFVSFPPLLSCDILVEKVLIQRPSVPSCPHPLLPLDVRHPSMSNLSSGRIPSSFLVSFFSLVLTLSLLCSCCYCR